MEKSENEKNESLKRSVVAQEKRMEELLDQLQAEKHTFIHAEKALQLKRSKLKQELQEKIDELYAKKMMQGETVTLRHTSHLGLTAPEFVFTPVTGSHLPSYM